MTDNEPLPTNLNVPSGNQGSVDVGEPTEIIENDNIKGQEFEIPRNMETMSFNLKLGDDGILRENATYEIHKAGVSDLDPLKSGEEKKLVGIDISTDHNGKMIEKRTYKDNQGVIEEKLTLLEGPTSADERRKAFYDELFLREKNLTKEEQALQKTVTNEARRGIL